MLFLKQSTASQAVVIGPFVDDTDGKTAETGLTIANTDIHLSKNGGTFADKNSGGATHDANGWYAITLDATDTATVGRLQIEVSASGALPVFAEFQVVEESIYDALFASSAAFPSNFGALLVNASGHIERVVLADTTTANTDMRGTDSAYTGTPPTAASIRSEIDSNSTQLAAIVEDTGTTIPALFPANFATLGINVSGHVSRVTVVDTTTANTDMRGTDSAYTGTPPTAAAIRSEIDSNSTQLGLIIDGQGYNLSILAGAISNAGSATEAYSFSYQGSTYTATYAGLTEDGDRGTTVLGKS